MNAETEEKSQTLRLNVIELCNLLSKSFMVLSEYFLEFEGEGCLTFHWEVIGVTFVTVVLTTEKS